LGVQENRTHIRIELTNGTVLYRQITNVVKVDNATEDIVVGTQFDYEIAPAQIHKIAFLALARLDADRVEMAWVTPNHAKVRFPVIEITGAI